MDNEELIEVPVKEDEIKDELLPVEINDMPLTTETNKLVANIIESEDVDELKSLTKMFTLNQAKKNALRIVKLNSLLDMVNDQAIARIAKRPDEISNKELLDYMNVVSTQIEKSQKSMAMVEETPLINWNQQNNSVTVNVNSESKMDRDSKEKVIDAVRELLKMVKTPGAVPDTNIQTPMTVELNDEKGE